MRNPVEQRAVRLFAPLDFVPVTHDLVRPGNDGFPEYVRMSTHELFAYCEHHVVRTEGAIPARELGQKRYLQGEIAEFVHELRFVSAVDRVDDLARLLEHVRS
jgi:hypothetical protein